jgi:CheY-like chemotaxis protein
VLAGKTEFGRFIQPLAQALFDLPNEEQTESMQTLELIHDFIKGREKELSAIEFTREDSLFMVTDKVGSLIRRPIIHTHFAQQMDDQLIAEGDDEGELKDVLVKGLRANAWSRFVAEAAGIRDKIGERYPNEAVFVDYIENANQFEQLMDKNPVCAYGLVRQAIVSAGEFYEKYAKPIEDEYFLDKELATELGQPKVFITDPGHAFGVKADLNLYEAYVSTFRTHDQVAIGSMELVKQASFMLVEDNPPHTLWAKLLADVKNLEYFKPPTGEESGDESTRRYEERGVYSNAERALEVMDKFGKPPDVLLSDIELGPGMNGIDLVRKLHKEHPDAIILMVYSSNPGAYDLDCLRREGVISGAWDKKDFKPHHMINTINEELTRRGKAE